MKHKPIVYELMTNGTAFFQLCARRGALNLEIVGLKRRGQSAYSICKQVYGLKGSRASVLKQIDQLIDSVHKLRKSLDSHGTEDKLDDLLAAAKFSYPGTKKGTDAR